MNARNFSRLDPRKAGAIRRVVRHGRSFCCGLCRCEHPSEFDALECVRDCWIDFQNLEPIIPRRRGIGIAYRCRFCARDYATVPGASLCAKECKELFELRLAVELKAVGVDDSEPRKPRRRAPMRLVMAALPAPKKKKADEEHPAETTLAPPAEDTVPVNADVKAIVEEAPLEEVAEIQDAPTKTAAAASSSGKKPKNGKDGGFYRDGAKYVCNECHAKYFTRNEVIACFEKH